MGEEEEVESEEEEPEENKGNKEVDLEKFNEFIKVTGNLYEEEDEGCNDWARPDDLCELKKKMQWPIQWRNAGNS